MHNIYVDPINQIKLRIDNAVQAGFPYSFPIQFTQQLAGSFVRVGDYQEVQGNDQLPCIWLKFMGADERIACISSTQGELVAELRVQIVIMFPVEDVEQTNKLYNSTTQKGILYFIPELLDKISTDYAAGQIDLRFNQNASRSVRFSVGEVEQIAIDKQRCIIDAVFESKNYALNKRVKFD